MQFLVRAILLFLWGVMFASADAISLPERNVLETRYFPFAKSEISEFQLKATQTDTPEQSWWRTAEEIRAARSDSARVLEGLRLVLDPGHIGGEWAAIEARHFKMYPDDFWVREGELALEVAQRVQADLEAMGAKVWLTRNESRPVNRKVAADYCQQALQDVEPPALSDLSQLEQYYQQVYDRACRLAYVLGDIAARARWINEEIRPDAVVSIHFNAAAWPSGDVLTLVDSNHLHVLIFGAVTLAEAKLESQMPAILKKVINGSGSEEMLLGKAVVTRLKEATQLPATNYSGDNAVLVEGSDGYVWARNLMLLRMTECPTVLLEPYIANSVEVYPRIQKALEARKRGGALPPDDIILEYARAVVAGVRDVYGPQK